MIEVSARWEGAGSSDRETAGAVVALYSTENHDKEPYMAV